MPPTWARPFIKKLLYWLLILAPTLFILGLILGFLFFFSVDAAANNHPNLQYTVTLPDNAWIDSTNATIYRPNEPLVEVDWEYERKRFLTSSTKTTNGLSSQVLCSCVLYVESRTGINLTVGFAKFWPINSQEPQVGAVVVLAEGPVGHDAYVESFTEDTITISETNYVHCQFTIRTLARSAPQIRGYYIRN